MLGGDELPLGHLGVVIDGAGEGGEGCGDLACARVAVVSWGVSLGAAGQGRPDLPWRAGDDVEGASAKASRSRRTDDDCLSAELKREFCGGCQCVLFMLVLQP